MTKRTMSCLYTYLINKLYYPNSITLDNRKFVIDTIYKPNDSSIKLCRRTFNQSVDRCENHGNKLINFVGNFVAAFSQYSNITFLTLSK